VAPRTGHDGKQCDTLAYIDCAGLAGGQVGHFVDAVLVIVGGNENVLMIRYQR
jgi:hypothetical protein